MSKYTGWKCPICECDFNSKDDIVVCPDCGAPHHRVCYKKQNHCSYEQTHGTKEQFTPPAIEIEAAKVKDENLITRCPKCSRPATDNSIFCKSCGYPILMAQDNKNKPPSFSQTYNRILSTKSGIQLKCKKCGYNNAMYTARCYNCSQVFNDELFGVITDELEEYVGDNNSYYLSSFLKIKDKKPTFNFFAALFPPLYFIYRKMYLWALLFFIITLIISGFQILFFYSEISSFTLTDYISMSAIEIIRMFLSFLSLGATLSAGFFANKIYLNKTVKDIKKARLIKQDDIENVDYKKLLKELGGTSISSAIFFVSFVGIVAYMIFNIINK